jgi:hypothetical protein
MVRDERSFFRRDLGRAGIQAAIDLARVGGDNFAMEMLRQGNTERTLARCGWPKHDNQVL